MPDGLYERDALAWAEQQAALLRRLADGERVNASIDWANVIGEVHDVGLSQLNSVRSLWRQAMLHVLKLHAWPQSAARAHWRAELDVFLADAEDRFAPSMAQRIDLGVLYLRAVTMLENQGDASGAGLKLPATCPFTMGALLAGDPAALLAEARAGAEGAAS